MLNQTLARVLVRPIVLSGPYGRLADVDLMLARRGEIRDLVISSIALWDHCKQAIDVRLDWTASSGEPVTAVTQRGLEIHADNWRMSALRAICAEAIMAACD